MKIKIIRPGFELMTPIEQIRDYPRQIEAAGRTCYKSEDKITDDSAGRFIRMLVKSGHHSVLEHCSITVRIICDRACSHQLVRHRAGSSYSQESQRYCDYSKGGEEALTVIHQRGTALRVGVYATTSQGDLDLLAMPDQRCPSWAIQWLRSISLAYHTYAALREDGIPPEDARSVLPNATKTEVVTTFNLRQWRHVFEHRALNKRAQWQIREIMLGILTEFARMLPDVFGDLREKEEGNAESQAV